MHYKDPLKMSAGKSPFLNIRIRLINTIPNWTFEQPEKIVKGKIGCFLTVDFKRGF